MAFPIERVIEEASQLARRWAEDPRRARRRKRKRERKKKILRAIALMMIVTFVVIPAMIAGGFLFGPRGVEGLIAAPVVLLLSWLSIFFYVFRRPATRQVLAAGPIAQLPAQTGEWLDFEREGLPWKAQGKIDSIEQRIESLTPQLAALNADAPQANEVRRLLSEELPELVRGYRKVPKALVQQPLYGGATPETQLLEGLETIDKQLGRVHEQLAKDDLHALATHQRYLELKYGNEDDEPK